MLEALAKVTDHAHAHGRHRRRHSRVKPYCACGRRPVQDARAAYEKGDYANALQLHRPLADQGNAHAQHALGNMYFYAQGVPQDYVQAYILFNLAAALASDPKSHDFAVKNRDYIAAKMTPVQIAEAQKAFADTLTLKCSFIGLIPEDVTYNVNRDTKEVEVIGKFGTHKGMLLSNTEGFFYV